jgi:hypothetical protein
MIVDIDLNILNFIFFYFNIIGSKVIKYDTFNKLRREKGQVSMIVWRGVTAHQGFDSFQQDNDDENQWKNLILKRG